ncbi:MAG: hypothetical protein HZA63_10285 [Rhodocyclales bacterium]|nr:hypothetical protein [Rhodocyclales bacterium]
MLTLIVPGLIWTRQALADLTHDLPLPAFTALLGRGALIRRASQASSAVLAELFELPEPLPAAALRHLALRGDTADEEWLCLDPVRLQFHDRSLIVDHPRHLQLDAAEAAALAVSLAPTFAELGQIEVLAPDSWNLRLTDRAPEFIALPDAAGRSAAPLPSGPAHAPWRRAINEAQMILHTHPVNLARESAGRPLVNSLWPWGAGQLPPARDGAYGIVWGDDPVLRGIAQLFGAVSGALPEGFPASLPRNALALVDALEQPARTGNAIAWRDALADFEANWLAPAHAALRSGRLDALRLLAPGDLGSSELNLRRRDLWRFWRKPRPLTELTAA